MQYNKQFTNQGLNLFSQATSEKQALIIDQVLVDNLPTNSLPDLSSITADDLSNHQSYQANYTSTDGSTLTIDSVMSNANFSDDYQVNEIAIMGHIANDQSTEALVAILTATNAFVLPKQLQGDSPIKFVPTIKINYVNSNQSNVNVQVSDGAYVARQDLDAIFDQKLGNLNAPSQDDLKAIQNALQNKADKSDIDNINNRINNINTSSGGGTVIPNNPSSNQPTNQFDSNGITIGGQKVYVKDNKLMYNNDRILTTADKVLTPDDMVQAPQVPNLSIRLTQKDHVKYTVNAGDAKGNHATPDSYTVYYKQDGDKKWQSDDLSKDNNSNEFQPDDKTTYDVKAVAHSKQHGDSKETDVQTIEGAHEPTNVNIKLTPQAPKGIAYSISADMNGSPISNYTIYYRYNSGSQGSTAGNWYSRNVNNNSGMIEMNGDGLYLAKDESPKLGDMFDFMATATNNTDTSKNSNIQTAMYYDSASLNTVLNVLIESNSSNSSYIELGSASSINWAIAYPNVQQVKLYLAIIPYSSNNNPSVSDVINCNNQISNIYPIGQVLSSSYSEYMYSNSEVYNGIPNDISKFSIYTVAVGLDSNGNSTGLTTQVYSTVPG